MAGFSFLVSPETQEQVRTQAALQQEGLNQAFGAMKQQQQIQEQSALAAQREQAADARAAATNTRMYNMQADRLKQQMDLDEKKTADQKHKEWTDEMQKNWSGVQSGINTQRSALLKNSNLYPDDQVSAYNDAMTKAEAQSQQMVQEYQDKIAGLGPNDPKPDFDWNQLPIYNVHYSLTNPAIRARVDAQTKLIGAQTAEAETRAGQIEQRMGTVPPQAMTALKGYVNSYANYQGANSYYNSLVDAGVKDPQTLADAKAKADAAYAQYNNSSASLIPFASDGHYGQKVQQAVSQLQIGTPGASSGGLQQPQQSSNGYGQYLNTPYYQNYYSGMSQ